jgi:hypothetical protein
MRHFAFVLSRPSDYPMAWHCVHRLTEQGWAARIMLDREEWPAQFPMGIHAAYSTQGRGMFGVPCAMAIASSILYHSNPGDIVAKFDCDIRLTGEASKWLMDAHDAGRAFTLGRQAWGGCWSASRLKVAEVLAKLEAAEPCSCPESALFISGFRNTPGGLFTHPDLEAAKWQPGRDWPAHAGCLTLPTRCGIPRAECGEALFT